MLQFRLSRTCHRAAAFGGSTIAVARLLFALLLLTFNFQLSTFAQFTGYSAPLGTQTTLFTNTACTGAPQTAAITNNAQTEHYMTITTSGVLAFRATVQGSNDGITYNDISDVAAHSGVTVMGQGYYAAFRASVTCATAAGTFSASYNGEATAPAPQIGAMLSSQEDKTIAVAAPAGANFTSQTIRAPFGNTGGGIYFSFAAAGPAGSTLNVGCSTLALSNPLSVASFPLATAAGMQFFTVALLPCDFVTVTYTSGAASATTWTASYVFNPITVTGGDPCQAATAVKKSAAINAAAATQKVVADLAGHQVFVCGWEFTLSTTAAAVPTAQWQAGTGAACAGANVLLGGAENGIASSSLRLGSAGGGYAVTSTASGSGLCLVVPAANSSAQGILTYVQQ